MKIAKPEYRVEELPLREQPSLAEAVARLAYAYWEAEGRPEGGQMRHWLRAEAEVLEARGLPPPPAPPEAA